LYGVWAGALLLGAGAVQAALSESAGNTVYNDVLELR
jgi:hypothetical protein